MRSRTSLAARVVLPGALVGVVLGVATACGGDEIEVSETAVTVAAGPSVTAPTTASITTAPTTPPIAPTTAPTSRPTAAPTTASTTVAAEPPVFDFAEASAAEGWLVVNDTVMGGVSSGQLAWEDDELVFTGDLSLDNNGGFVSMRSPAIDTAVAARWALRPGPRVQATGDGRLWVLEVRTDDAVDGGWIAELPTTAGSTIDQELPWASFEPVTRFLEPRVSEVPLDPSRVVSVALYLLDGVEAPFRLAVRSIG